MFSTDAIHAGGRGRRPPPTLLKEVRIKLTSDILEGRASPTPPKISLSDTPAHKTRQQLSFITHTHTAVLLKSKNRTYLDEGDRHYDDDGLGGGESTD